MKRFPALPVLSPARRKEDLYPIVFPERSCIYTELNKILRILFLFMIPASLLRGQNFLEAGIGYAKDRNFNHVGRHLYAVHPFYSESIPFIDNRWSVLASLRYEHHLTGNISALLSARAVIRKINYTTQGTVIGDFLYTTLEVPLGLRYRKRLNDQLHLRFDLEGGVNYIVSPDEVTRISTMDKGSGQAHFQFVRNTALSYLITPGIGLESRIRDGSFITFFLAFQYQVTPTFRYRAFDRHFDLYGSDMNAHYLSLGLSYQFRIKKRSV
jgi:hypothetical protein